MGLAQTTPLMKHYEGWSCHSGASTHLLCCQALRSLAPKTEMQGLALYSVKLRRAFQVRRLWSCGLTLAFTLTSGCVLVTWAPGFNDFVKPAEQTCPTLPLSFLVSLSLSAREFNVFSCWTHLFLILPFWELWWVSFFFPLSVLDFSCYKAYQCKHFWLYRNHLLQHPPCLCVCVLCACVL